MEFQDGVNTQPITREQALADIINSIASEETALSELINTEAKKNNAIALTNQDDPTPPSSEHIIQHCQSIYSIVNSIHMKEWLLLKKLETIIYTNGRLTRSTDEHDSDPG